MFASVFSSPFGDLTRMKHKNSNNALPPLRNPKGELLGNTDMKRCDQRN